MKLSPTGEVLKDIDVLGKMPSNLYFGGPDGRTAYVTEVEHTRVVKFRSDRPGLAWQRWQDATKKLVRRRSLAWDTGLVSGHTSVTDDVIGSAMAGQPLLQRLEPMTRDAGRSKPCGAS